MNLRTQEAKRLRDSGLKLREVGARLGVSASRARQMVLRAERELRKNPEWTDGLSERIKNCLLSAGGKSKSDVLAMIDDLKLSKIPNLGNKSIAEIRAWLGLGPNAELCGSPKRSVGESERTPGYAAGGNGERK